MKHIKSYRIFESKTSDIFELLDLGLISWEDVSALIKEMGVTSDSRELMNAVIAKFGIEEVLEIFTVDEVKSVYDGNPFKYLEQFNNLRIKPGEFRTYYIDKNGERIFYYFTKTDDEETRIYINPWRLWNALWEIFDLRYGAQFDALEIWLKEAYGFKDISINRSDADNRNRHWLWFEKE